MKKKRADILFSGEFMNIMENMQLARVCAAPALLRPKMSANDSSAPLSSSRALFHWFQSEKLL